MKRKRKLLIILLLVMVLTFCTPSVLAQKQAGPKDSAVTSEDQSETPTDEELAANTNGESKEEIGTDAGKEEVIDSEILEDEYLKKKTADKELKTDSDKELSNEMLGSDSEREVTAEDVIDPNIDEEFLETSEDLGTIASKDANETDSEEDKVPLLSYKVHGRNYGWQEDYCKEFEVAGTIKKGLRLEAIQITANDPDLQLKYQVHVSGKGWMDPVGDDEIAGTVGERRAIEAIKISLTGEKADHYEVLYRSHCSNIGWQDWAKDGGISGTTGEKRPIEAIQIMLVALPD